MAPLHRRMGRRRGAAGPMRRPRGLAVSALCAVLALAALLASAKVAEYDGPATLRLLSMNVLVEHVHDAERVPPLLKLLGEADADVLALQEVGEDFYGKLKAETWAQELHISPLDDGGQLIASRFPLSRCESHLLPGRQRRTALSCRVGVASGRYVGVTTMHMESYARDNIARAQQLDLLFEMHNDLTDAIVMGDANFGDEDESEVEREHVDGRFTDVWKELRPDDAGFTWDVERNPLARIGSWPDAKGAVTSHRVDHVWTRFSTGAWRPADIRLIANAPVSASLPHVFPSDHFGLVCELKHESAVEQQQPGGWTADAHDTLVLGTGATRVILNTTLGESDLSLDVQVPKGLPAVGALEFRIEAVERRLFSQVQAVRTLHRDKARMESRVDTAFAAVQSEVESYRELYAEMARMTQDERVGMLDSLYDQADRVRAAQAKHFELAQEYRRASPPNADDAIMALKNELDLEVGIAKMMRELSRITKHPPPM